MTKGNWVNGPNVRLDRIADWAGETNMAEYEMAQRARRRNTGGQKIEKKKGNKNREEFLGC
jgi:hypothetical protein